MTATEYSTELTEEEFEDYIGVALANGFSKGTANITPADMKRLRPLLNHYRKNPHPFRACVRDNRKRFGPKVNAYCAVIKDLIEGSTKWRGKKKGMSESTLTELFGLEVDRDFILFLSELSEEEIQQMMAGQDEIETESTELAQGDVVWNPGDGFNNLRKQIEFALNGSASEMSGGYNYWVEDVTRDKALVCEKGTDYYVVPYTMSKGNVELAAEEEWLPVTRAWVEEKVSLSDEPELLAEIYFADTVESKSKVGNDGLIWKPILREGTWMFSPGSDAKARPKKLTIVKDGVSDGKNLTISMAELKKNFDSKAIEHVTIPTSHADTVLENTGFIRKLKIGTDEKGRAVLEAGMDFTEPDVKEKAERGTIANTSAGVLFDYIHKEKGKKFTSVLAHAALTNRPWINGMKPFGVQASENLQIIGFSEENNDPASTGGGEEMSTTEFDFTSLGFSSEEELREALAERSHLKAKDRERDVADRCKQWQEEGKSPALVAEARNIMMADEGSNILNLSEDGKSVLLTATDIVERLVSQVPSVQLSNDPVTEEQSSNEKPDDEEVQLSHEEKVLANQIFLTEGLSVEKSVEEAKRRLKSGNQ